MPRRDEFKSFCWTCPKCGQVYEMHYRVADGPPPKRLFCIDCDPHKGKLR